MNFHFRILKNFFSLKKFVITERYVKKSSIMSRPRNVTRIGLFLSQENDRMGKVINEACNDALPAESGILSVQSSLARLSSSIRKYVLSKFRGKIGFNKAVVPSGTRDEPSLAVEWRQITNENVCSIRRKSAEMEDKFWISGSLSFGECACMAVTK